MTLYVRNLSGGRVKHHAFQMIHNNVLVGGIAFCVINAYKVVSFELPD
jgi:hypothetical protein